MVTIQGKNFHEKLIVDKSSTSTSFNLNCGDESMSLRAFVIAVNQDSNNTEYASEESNQSNKEEFCIQCKVFLKI